jgi:hydrogenase maturation protease
MTAENSGGGAGRVAVLALGNVLMRDDALGPHVLRRLEARYEFPPAVSLVELGTPGLDLHPHLDGLEVAIVVDAVRADGRPGELRLYRREEILRHAPGPRVSPHDPGLKEALLGMEFAGRGPSEVLLVGIIPEDTGYGIGLTPAVAGALEGAEAAVLEELRRLGLSASESPNPGEPDLWWEHDPGAAKS